MKRILLTIAFDGTNYHGWQFQPNALTIQQVLNRSLEELLGTPCAVTGCSRTDAGVHASEFACHLDCDDNIPKNAFLKGLNSILPNDIAVLSCEEVNSDFHARYNAKGKQYVYGMYTGAKNPFDERYFLHLNCEPCIKLMNDFAQTVVGKHDFCGFSSSGRTVKDTVRTVSECLVQKSDNRIYFSVTADGFLYNMVRILAGTALAVGYGKCECSVAEKIFLTGDRSLGGDTLPPHGLFLKKVIY